MTVDAEPPPTTLSLVVDTSAVIAILKDEVDAADYREALARADRPGMSAATYVEAAIVVDANKDPVLSGRFDDLVSVARIIVSPVTARQAETARRAFAAFGKGSGHPAGLNFGDCFAYALARTAGAPLLFKGDDFGHTDVEPAIAAAS